MITCPKCSKVNTSDPRWAAATPQAGEALIYTCQGCGYESRELPHDALKRPRPDVVSGLRRK